MVDVMDFFDSLPEPPPPPERPPAPPRPVWMRPVAALPAAMAENAIIVRDERLAISIGGLSVYPNGFDFSVHIRSRSRADEIDPLGHRRRRDYKRNSGGGDSGDPSQNLRVGVLFSDGRRTASNQSRHHFAPDHERDPDELVMQQGAGGGGDRSWDMSFWIHPLPPEGPVTIVISWLAHGIAEVRHEIDGAAVLAAAEQAVQLWPEDQPLEGWVGIPQ
jgi:hypothetical protein